MSELALKLIAEAKEIRKTRLDLGNCGLTELPDELFELTWLEELILKNGWYFGNNYDVLNNLTNIPSQIGKLKNLKKLIVCGETDRPWQLIDLNNLIELSNLEYIDLSHTQVNDLSPLKNLTQLTVLSLSSTKINDLSPLKNLTQLTVLYLSLTKINDLSPLKNLTQLTNLSISSTQVNDLSPLKNLTQLSKLSAFSTNVSDLNPLENLTMLFELNLSYTKIKDLSSLTGLTNLLELYIHNNEINDLKPLRNLVRIRRLHIQYTQVSDLSPLSSMKELENLSFTSTKVTDISVFNDLKKIQKFYYNRSPITNPPIEIVREGLRAIRNYFKQVKKQGGSEEINEAKLIIVGEGGTGKTTLFEKLKDPRHNPCVTPTSETHGINILEGLAFADGFRANLWDFGGQELQYMTHQFFLTPRALYVLMMDARRESPNLAYWFKIISLLGRESDTEKAQVLLVFNKRKNSTGTPQYNDLLEHYKDDFDYEPLTVDFADNDRRWVYLKQTIEARLSSLVIQLPKQWKPIREALSEEAKKHPYISSQRFSEICTTHNIPNKDDQSVGSRALHKLGQILHFDEKGLRSHIIISPKWAVNGVYTFLEDASIADNKGRFTEHDFIKILENKGYSAADADLILLLMTRNHFDICYKSKNSNDYVAAQLLPDNRPPQYKWHPEVAKGGALQFRYQYTTMPKGLISRLIVRLSEHIERINNVEVVWKKGAILCIKNNGQICRVLIQEDDAESKTSLKQIKIEVLGDPKYRKFALQKVRDEVDELHKKWFRNIQADEIVPCCCDKCLYSETPKSYLLSDLLELWQEDEVKQCTTGKKIGIQRLLEGVYDSKEVENLFYDGKDGRQYLGKKLSSFQDERMIPNIHVHIENKQQMTQIIQNNGLNEADVQLLKELLAKLSDDKKEGLKTFVETLPEPEDEDDKQTYGKQIIKWLNKNAEGIVGNVAASVYYDTLKHLLGIG